MGNLTLELTRENKSPIQKNTFADVFFVNRTQLLGIANSYVNDHAAAEDIVHDVFTRLLELPIENEIRSPKSYLVSAVRNRAFNFLERSERKYAYSTDKFLFDNLVDTDPCPERSLQAEQHFHSLVDAIETLPKQCKRVLLLCKLHGFSLKGTAKELGISVSTVQKHLTKARSSCAVHLSTQGFG